jgi:hypothetical protein
MSAPRLSNSVYARGHLFNSEPEEREDAAEVLNSSSATYQARGLQNKTSKKSLRNVWQHNDWRDRLEIILHALHWSYITILKFFLAVRNKMYL